MAEAAAAAGVPVVTGDTKVVDRGAADGMYITTAGVGAVPAGRDLTATAVTSGRATSSSPRGRWATTAPRSCWRAVTSPLEADIASDSAPLHGLVDEPPRRGTRHAVAPGLHPRRRRDGLQRARRAHAHRRRRARRATPARCGRRWRPLASCSGSTLSTWRTRGNSSRSCHPQEADAALDALRAHAYGCDAARIGEIRAEPPGIVVLRTVMGGTRIRRHARGRPAPPHLLTDSRSKVRAAVTPDRTPPGNHWARPTHPTARR